MRWHPPSVICVSGEEQTGGLSRRPGAGTLGESFSPRCSNEGQPGRHRGTPGGEVPKRDGKPATVDISELWGHGGQSLVFRVLRDGSIFFFFQLRLNTPAREKSTLAHLFVYSALL